MRARLFLLPIAALASAMPRVRRQWGPADFYHFEQWVNYINRPRQEFSGDAPGYHTGVWGNLERNVQPHQAPPGWRLDHGNGHWGLIPPQTGYGLPMRPTVANRPTMANRPPMIIETNVFGTNDNRYFPTETAYVTPPNVLGSEIRTVPTSATTEATTTTTTRPTTTITEDERERFIQTAVKEDMDRVIERMGPVDSTESTTTSTSMESTTVEQTAAVEAGTTTAGLLSGFLAELPSEATTANGDSNGFSSSLPPQTSSSDLASGFTNLDYNTVWSEENTEALSTTPIVPIESTTKETKSTFIAKMEEITPSSTETPPPVTEKSTEESTTLGETSSSLVPTSETTEAQTEPTTTGTAFLVDMLPGLRAPPLPVDIAKKLQELGVATEKHL